MRLQLITAAVLMSLVALSAQGRVARTFNNTDRHAFAISKDNGSVRLAVPGWGFENVTPGIAEPGDTEALFSTSDSPTSALCGKNGTNGVFRLYAWNKPNSAFDDKGVYSEAGSDFVGVAYSETKGQLYLLDAAKKRIIHAAYAPGAATPQTWTELVNDQTWSVLASMNDHEMLVIEDGVEPTIGLVHHWAGEKFPLHKVKIKANGQLEFSVLGGPGAAAASLDELLLTPGQTTVKLTGPPGVAVDVVKFFEGVQTVVGTTTLDSAGKGTATVTALVNRAVYGAKSSLWTDPTPYYLSPQRTWGSRLPLPLPNGYSIDPMSNALGLLAHIGASDFDIAALAIAGTQSTVPVTYSATLMIGSPSDVVDLGGGSYALLGPASQSVPLEMKFQDTPGVAAVPLPIANDPNLVGVEVAFQWWITVSPTDVRLTDIASVPIRASEWEPPCGPAAAQSHRSGPRLKPTPAQRAIALSKWLGASSHRSISAREKADLLRTLKKYGNKFRRRKR